MSRNMESTISINLPTELVLQICELLYDTHLSSLVNFASSNKACYAVAAVFLSRTIRIFADKPEHLITSVQEQFQRLHRLGVLRDVHRLVIYGPDLHHPGRPKSTYRSIPIPVFGLEGRRFNDPQLIRQRYKSEIERVYEVNDSWLPLVDLIQQLPTLTDLIYKCYDQFPPCLLQALHQYRPNCRLHIDNFCLRSLVTNLITRSITNLATNTLIEDPHEFMIATSPCLYSVRILEPYFSLQETHIAAALPLVAGLAPNLKEVYIYRSWLKLPTSIDLGRLYLLPSYKDLLSFKEFPPVLSSLSCLQLSGRNRSLPISEQLLTEWSTLTDFTVLQTLVINTLLTRGALAYLANATHKFPSLETLIFTLDDSPRDPGRYYQLVNQLICNLQGLRTLKITGWSRLIDLGSILGSKLRGLTLIPCEGQHLEAQHITGIRERCPFLENLAMAIRRTKGDVNETAIYRELGTFPKLENLNLHMYMVISHPTRDGHTPPLDPSFDDFDREPSTQGYWKGDIRDLFINRAIDDTLALAIFEIASGVKQRHSLVSLEKLDMQFVDEMKLVNGKLYGLNLGKYGVSLSRVWQVTRSPRDDSRQSVFARELGKKNRESNEAHYEVPTKINTAELESIFRRIWPERWEGSDWAEDWHSWPLSTSTT
ncbi:hypothetical protein F4781DRAFT_136111 [Annulohypoxylon bovei var. microspora]|nr:hypothetical protein F4781DRAFT_136111 [Annulohypoxylon bovei var. microspora]